MLGILLSFSFISVPFYAVGRFKAYIQRYVLKYFINRKHLAKQLPIIKILTSAKEFNILTLKSLVTI